MKKRTKLIIMGIILIVGYLVITSTYSKYVSSIEIEASRLVAKWKIDINQSDITTNDNNVFTFDENGSKYYEWYDEYDRPTDKLAPGGYGFFYIVLDTSACQTSLEHSLKIDLTELYDVRGVCEINLTSVNLCEFSLSGTDILIDRYISTMAVTTTAEAVEQPDGTNKTHFYKTVGSTLLDYADVGKLTGYVVRYDWTNNDAKNQADYDLASSGVDINAVYYVDINQYKGI